MKGVMTYLALFNILLSDRLSFCSEKLFLDSHWNDGTLIKAWRVSKFKQCLEESSEKKVTEN